MIDLYPLWLHRKGFNSGGGGGGGYSLEEARLILGDKKKPRIRLNLIEDHKYKKEIKITTRIKDDTN